MHSKKIFSLILFLAVFGFLFNFGALKVQALTSTEIRALIQQLQQQIVQLQQQLAETEKTEKVWCHNFNIKLKYGDTGEEVKALHIALEKDGFDISDEEKNQTSYGDFTAAAVVGFQEKYKNEILFPWKLKRGTGAVSAYTLAKLNKLFSCGAAVKIPTIPITPLTVTPPTVTTTTTAAIPAAQASITVLSPNGGEDLATNSLYPVRISVPQGNQKEIGFVLYDDSIKLGSLIGSRLSETIFNWTVGQYQDQSGNAFVSPAGKKYRIALTVPGQSEPVDFSDNYFGTILMTALNGPLTALSPNGGEKWIKGNAYKIDWAAIDVKNTDNVALFLTDQTSIPWKLIDIAKGLPASLGSYSWTVPADDTISLGNNYKILMTSKLKGAPTGTIGMSDQSDNYFSVVAAATTTINQAPDTPSIQPGSVHTLGEKVGEAAYFIFSSKDPDGGSSYLLTYNIDWGDGTSKTCISSYIPNIKEPDCQASHSFTQAGIYNIIVRATDEKGAESGSASLSYKISKAIVIISPNSGEQWKINSSYDITWKSYGVNNINIDFSKGNKEVWPVASNTPASDGKFSWQTEGLEPGNYYKINIWDVQEPAISDQSDNFFNLSYSYPGFFMSADKQNYSQKDIIQLKIQRVDGKTFPYYLDLYGIEQNKTSETKVLISKGLEVSSANGLIKSIDTNLQEPFKSGQANSYLLLICASGELCQGGANTNSLVVYYKMPAAIMNQKESQLASISEAVSQLMEKMEDLLKK